MKDQTVNGLKISVVGLGQECIGHSSEDAFPMEEQKNVVKEEKGKHKKNKNAPNKLQICVAEFVGTGFLMFLGCLGCVTEYETVPVPHYMSSLTFGLTVMMIIQMFGHISGAHLNPSVSIVALIYNLIDIKQLPFYLVGEFAGAVCGFGALTLILPDKYTAQDFVNPQTSETETRIGLCTTDLSNDITVTQGLFMEIAITAVLILICCAIWDKRNETKVDSIPLRFGFIIAAISMASGPFTGASMNTARSFAPALINNNWTNHWIYWVGPNVGALIAAYLYKFLFALPNEEDGEQEIPLSESVRNGRKV